MTDAVTRANDWPKAIIFLFISYNPERCGSGAAISRRLHPAGCVGVHASVSSLAGQARPHEVGNVFDRLPAFREFADLKDMDLA